MEFNQKVASSLLPTKQDYIGYLLLFTDQKPDFRHLIRLLLTTIVAALGKATEITSLSKRAGSTLLGLGPPWLQCS